MCVFSLYFKALDRKGVCKVFQNNFLFDNWQQFKSIMRKKKEQTPSQNYWPAHPKPWVCWWVGVCLCLHGLHGTRTGASSVPCPPARVGGYSVWSRWAQVPLGKLLFWFEALFFLASPSFQTPPQFPGLLSEQTIWLQKLPSLQNSLGNRNCINSDTHTDFENTTWMNGYILCVCVCVCVQ